MSTDTRRQVAYHKNIRFQKTSQRDDILDQTKVHTFTVAILQHILKQGWKIEITAMNSDHHKNWKRDTNPTGRGVHEAGLAFDFWLIDDINSTYDKKFYMKPDDRRFRKFLGQLKKYPFFFQVGLAGTADSWENIVATGLPYPYVFQEQTDDHIHIGVKASR